MKKLIIPLVVAASAVPLLVLAVTIYTADIDVTNEDTDTAITGGVAELNLSGEGLSNLTSNLLRVSIEDAAGDAAIWEARTDASAWRLLVPSLGAAASATFDVAIDSATAIETVGAWAYATVPNNAGTQLPGANPLNLYAHAYTGPFPDPVPTTVASVDAIEQYPSSTRMAESSGTLCIAYIDGQQALTVCSTDLGRTWGSPTGITFAANQVPHQVSIAAAEGFVHMAVYTIDQSTDPYVQDWTYARGVLSGNTASWGTTTSIDSVSQAASAGALLDHGVSVTLVGSSFNTPSVLYAYTSAVPDTFLKRRTSSVANTWSAPTTTTAISIGGGANRYATLVHHVKNGGATTNTVALYLTLNVAATIQSYDAAGTFTNSLPIPQSTAAQDSENFTCVNSSSTVVLCVYQSADAQLKSLRYEAGAWNVDANITGAITGQVYPALTYTATWPDITDGTQAIATWTEPDGTISQAHSNPATVSWSSVYDIGSGAVQGGATAPQRISNSARYGFGLNSLAGVVTPYQMPPIIAALFCKEDAYCLTMDPDGGLTWSVNDGAITTVTYTPSAGIHDIEVRWSCNICLNYVRIYVDSVQQATAVAGGGTINASTNPLTITHGWFADGLITEINSVDQTKWFAPFAESGGVYTSTESLNSQVATVQQFFSPMPDLNVVTNALTPVTVNIASSTTSETTADTFSGAPNEPGGDIYNEPATCAPIPLIDVICTVVLGIGMPPMDFFSPMATIMIMAGTWFGASRLWPTLFSASTGALAGLFMGSWLLTLPLFVPLIAVIPWFFIAVITIGRQPGTQ